MNKQGELINGKVVGGIEWVKSFLPDGTERQGFTTNPIKGCKHQCGWKMTDGSIANCYAEDVAEGVAQSAYPHGFAHHYWQPDQLSAPLSVKTPSKIFVGSMSDVFGSWVPQEQIEQVLEMCRKAHWHTFQFLTKNPPRLNRFDFPPNCWVGVSAPPTFMMGKQLTPMQQSRWFRTALQALGRCNAKVKWVSFEPLSFDITEDIDEAAANMLGWAVIGAASNGPKKYQPDPVWVENLLDLLDCYGIPVFFKGNLKNNPAAEPWREEFPQVKVLKQEAMF